MNDGEAWMLSKIVAGLVVVLGFFVYWTLSTEQFEDLLSDYEVNPSRRPASLVTVADIKQGQVITKALMSTIDLNCVDDKEDLKIKSHTAQLRIVGKLCNPLEDKDAKYPDIYISNTSNGFDATVFDRPKNNFTTDYVFLKNGTNRIVISALHQGAEAIVPLKEIVIEKTDRLVLDEDSQSPSDSM